MNEAFFLKVLTHSMPADTVRTVLDVGANVGDTTHSYLAAFPRAHIWSFEPVTSTFDALKNRYRHEPRVTPVQAALGRTEAILPMQIVGDSLANALVEKRSPGGAYEDVRVVSGDRFLHEHHLDRVDFLKVDTEGHDLDILVGLTASLRSHAIRYLQVEAGMNPYNLRHVSLERFTHFLEPLGYYLFYIYNQAHEYGHTILRRCDAVFTVLPD